MKRALFLVTLAIIAGFTVTFAFIDSRVAKRLNSPILSSGSAILSDSYKITTGAPLSKDMLQARLVSHNYVAIDHEPATPGEFLISDNFAQVVTRPFTAADGSTVKSQKASIEFSTGKLTANGSELDSLSLEPVPLASLGGSGTRASRFVPLSEIPQDVQSAVLAIEDHRFYHHLGVDPIGIARAMLENLRRMKFVQGGSTLTQQLAKNTLLTPKKTLGRKIMEMFAALSLERHLTKEQILEMYLNEIYLGQEGSIAIHGVEEAARTFFGKSIRDVSLGEASLLAGMIQAPSSFSPRKNLERALERRELVLQSMLEFKLITQERFDIAKKSKPAILQDAIHKRTAPFFLATVEQNLSDNLNIEAASVTGISVYTGIDPDLQNCAEKAVAAGVKNLETSFAKIRRKDKPIEQGLVALEPFSGRVRAYVGGRDFSQSQFDHVSQGKRQIGSTIKPFLYLTAMDGTLNAYKIASPISILSDEPTGITLVNHDVWTPENYDHDYRGDVTLRYALENSLNLPAVYVAERVGIPAVASTVRKFRLAEYVPEVPALALGAVDTSLLRLTSSFGALANGGIYVTPRLYTVVRDASGEELLNNPLAEERVVDDGAVYVLTDILRGVIERGTATVVRRKGVTLDVAGKTGTSNETRDAWFIGYSPTLVAGVWTGFDDNKKTGLTGGAASAPVWADFMKCASPYIDNSGFIPPPSVVSLDIDKTSRKLASAECPEEDVIKEVFVKGTEPRDYCTSAQTPVGSEFDEEQEREREEFPRRRRERREQEGPSFWDRIFG